MEAWRDNVHEHGTREHGKRLNESGSRHLLTESSRVEPREYILDSRPYVCITGMGAGVFLPCGEDVKEYAPGTAGIEEAASIAQQHQDSWQKAKINL